MKGGEGRKYMSEADRRQYPRHRVHFEIEITPDEARAPFRETVLLRDISDRGVSFITKNPEFYRIDQHLSISLHHSNTHIAHDLQGSATVKWLKHCDHSMNQAFVGVQLNELIESAYFIGD